MAYLAQRFTFSSAHKIDGLRVLELGCGSALPGIYAMQQSSVKSVDFRDFNREVLQYVTVPNILLNAEAETDLQHGGYVDATIDYTKLSQMSKVGQLWVGDWETLPLAMVEHKSEKFDLMLASEVLYFPSSYHKLISLLKHCLAVDGSVLVASKSYYFGCGGGIKSFLSSLEADEGSLCGNYKLSAEQVVSLDHMMGNSAVPREIIELRWI